LPAKHAKRREKKRKNLFADERGRGIIDLSVFICELFFFAPFRVFRGQKSYLIKFRFKLEQISIKCNPMAVGGNVGAGLAPAQ
jgi:hypothetical protein